MPNSNGNNKDPILTQLKQVQQNPFVVTQQVDQIQSFYLKVKADLAKQYVPTGAVSYPYLHAQPPYVDDISQQFGLQIYDQMLRDPVCHASQYVFGLGLLANGYEIVPSLSKEDSDFDIAEKMCKYVKENLDRLETSYDVILENHAMDAFSYGCSINEQSFEVDRGLLRLMDVRDKPHQNAIFIVDNYNRTIAVLTQGYPGQVYPATSYIPIDTASVTSALNSGNKDKVIDLSERYRGLLPRYRFSILTNDMKYNDERGRSGLRAAYSAWWFKQQNLAEWLSFLSKFGSPLLIGTTAQGDSGQTLINEETGEPLLDDTTNLPIRRSPQETMAAALEQVRNGSSLSIPFGAKVEAIKPEGDGEAFVKAMNWADMQIAIAITYQYLGTMEGQHQARASAEVHQDILSLGINRRKKWLAAQQRREVYEPLLRYNFDLTGKWISRYVPILKLGYGDGFPMKAAEIAALMTSGFLDESQKEGIDERLGLPKRQTITLDSGEKVTYTQKREMDSQQNQNNLQQQESQQRIMESQNRMNQDGNSNNRAK